MILSVLRVVSYNISLNGLEPTHLYGRRQLIFITMLSCSQRSIRYIQISLILIRLAELNMSKGGDNVTVCPTQAGVPHAARRW